MMRFLFAFLFTVCFVVGVRADNVLFVGNSLTGVNNMPGLFLALAQSKGLQPSVSVSLKFGQTLAVQLADPKVREFVSASTWDTVVLQEYSDLPLREASQFEASVLEFKTLVPGARVFLFENWPHSDSNASVMKQLDTVYDKVARASGATVVHLGRAFDHAARRTEIGVYADDRHPQPIATYMCALMMLDAVYGLAPSTFAPQGSATNTGEIVLGPATLPTWVDLNAGDAALVQQIAARFK